MHKLTPMIIFSCTLLALTLIACREPVATPPQVLPSLQRPVLTLSIAPTTPAQQLLIPAGAYIERGGLPGVFVLNAGQARFRMLRIGQHSAGKLEVLSGLAGNETLVLGDLTQIHDGSPIVVK